MSHVPQTQTQAYSLEPAASEDSQMATLSHFVVLGSEAITHQANTLLAPILFKMSLSTLAYPLES